MKTLKLNTKSLLSVAVITALGMSSNAMAKIGFNQQADVVKLGYSDSSLSDQLAQGYDLKAPSQFIEESKAAIAAKVADAEIIHVNFNDFQGEDARLNAYLTEAMKQEKLMVFENTDGAEISALPFMPSGDVVLIQPGYHNGTDSIIVYGNTTVEKQASDVRVIEMDKKGNTISEAQFAPKDRAFESKTDSLIDLQGKELTSALTNITSKIKSFVDSPKAQLKTGGAVEYDCPSAAKSERLCWGSFIEHNTYYHEDGDAKINVISFYRVGAYRTDQTTAIAISPHGSANPTLIKNGTGERAYFLESVQTTITPTSTDGMNLFSRKPENANNVTTVTSTKGMSYGISGGVDTEGPSMGGSITYSSSRSESTSIQDWETTTTTNGTNANWLYHVKHKSAGDWKTGWPIKIKGVPSISANGLQYTTEAIYVGNKDKSGYFRFGIQNKVDNTRAWIDRGFWTDTLYLNGWTHTINLKNYSFNNGWFKNL